MYGQRYLKHVENKMLVIRPAERCWGLVLSASVTFSISFFSRIIPNLVFLAVVVSPRLLPTT